MESDQNDPLATLAALAKRGSEPLQSIEDFLRDESERVNSEAAKRSLAKEAKQSKSQRTQKGEGIQANWPSVGKCVTEKSQGCSFIQKPRPSTAPVNASVAIGDSGVTKTTVSHGDWAPVNYVGRLLEYRQANLGRSGPTFTESLQNSAGGIICFNCTVTIGEREEPFGACPKIFFDSKKAAKQDSCRLAVEWLIQNRFMPATGATFPKAAAEQTKAPPKKHSQAPCDISSDGKPELPARSSINDLCRCLSLPLPTYVIEPNPEFGAMYSGYAHFGNDPRICGRVGEFNNIYGRQNAKETCKEEVLSFLERMQDQRTALAEAQMKGESEAALKRKQE